MLQVNPHAVPAPPVGSVGVGELLADANTRRLWLGVAAATNPAQALLVSDIVALQTEDADIRADFAELLNTGLATKAPLAHTHTASQITDFNAAVKTVIGPSSGVPTGCVITYAGQLSLIGQGSLVGYILCDGRSFNQVDYPDLYQVLGKTNVPDLRDRFAYGAGNQQPGFIGGSKDITGNTAAGGAHNHTGSAGGTAITPGQLPGHDHPITDKLHTHTGIATSHAHNYRRPLYTTAPLSGAANKTYSYDYDAVDTSARTATLTVDANGTGITKTEVVGLNQAHTHSISTENAHLHAINLLGVNLPPFVALAYIIKT